MDISNTSLHSSQMMMICDIVNKTKRRLKTLSRLATGPDPQPDLIIDSIYEHFKSVVALLETLFPYLEQKHNNSISALVNEFMNQPFCDEIL